jgi:membrane fusion protein, heavy metal efflux system
MITPIDCVNACAARVQRHVRRQALASIVGVAFLAAVSACGDRKDAEKGSAAIAASSAARDSTSSAAGMSGMAMPSGNAETGEKPKGSESAEGATPNEITFSAAQIAHGGVRWSPTTISLSSATATVPAQIVPNEDRTARLGAPARGRIVAVRVRPGDDVARGQILVTMQSAEAGMAQADVSKAEADLAAKKAQAVYAESARNRAQRLLALKAVPQQDYERAVADDELARAALAQAEAEVRRARSTARVLDASTASVSQSGEIALRSPLAGVVLARTATPSAVVEAGTPLVVVTDPSSLWVSIAAPETMAGLFVRGGTLHFTVPAFATDTFVARVEAVGAGLDADTRTLAVRAVTTAAKGKLKSAMLATVVVEGGRSVAAAIIPEDAVQILAGVPIVFVAVPDAKGGARLTKRAVVLGARAGGKVAVISGLQTDDLVVTRGAFAVRAEFQKSSMPKMEM